jgi:hypothetical protein
MIMYIMTHHFVHIICIVILSYIWNDFILVTFSYDILDIQVILSSIVDAIWMKTCNKKIALNFLLPHHRLLVKCNTNIWLQPFTLKIWSNIQLLQSIISCLRHIVIDFLVAKDKIFSSETYHRLWQSCEFNVDIKALEPSYFTLHDGKVEFKNNFSSKSFVISCFSFAFHDFPSYL